MYDNLLIILVTMKMYEVEVYFPNPAIHRKGISDSKHRSPLCSRKPEACSRGAVAPCDHVGVGERAAGGSLARMSPCHPASVGCSVRKGGNGSPSACRVSERIICRRTGALGRAGVSFQSSSQYPQPEASSLRKTVPQIHLVSASKAEPVLTSSLRRDLGSSRTVCTRYSFISQNGLFL